MGMCEVCKKRVPKKDPHGLPWIHQVCAKKEIEKEQKRNFRIDYDRIINEVGSKKLLETSAGRQVLENARKKYAAELVQPGDPEFKKLYGKEIKERQEIRRAHEERSRREWAESGDHGPDSHS